MSKQPVIDFDVDTSDDSELTDSNDNFHLEEEYGEEEEEITISGDVKAFKPKTWKEYLKQREILQAGKYIVRRRHTLQQTSASATADGKAAIAFEDPLNLVKKNTPGLEDFYLEKFNPKKFLATIHMNTEYSRLIFGHQLDDKKRFREEQMQGLVAENLNRFLLTKKTVIMLNEKGLLRSEHADAICTAVEKRRDEAANLFGNMILVKRKSETVKEVLNIMRKHQYLLDIPISLAQGIEKRDYHQVIYEYKKAKFFINVFQERESIFQQFLPFFQAIEKKVMDLRQYLFNMLIQHRDPNKIAIKSNSTENVEDEIVEIPLFDEEREKILGYLMNLDSPEEPDLYYLKEIYNFITQYLENTAKRHLDKVKALQIAYLIKDNRADKIKKQKNQRISGNEARSLRKLNVAIEIEGCKLVNNLGRIMAYYLDSFWTLAQNILNDKYHIDDQQPGMPDDPGSLTQLESPNDEGKLTSEARRENNQRQINEFFSSIVDTYIRYCDIALEEVDNDEVHPIAKCKCVQSIVQCHYVLEEKLEIQKSYIASLKKYTLGQHKRIIEEVWKRCLKGISALKYQENWKQVSENIQVTSLPIKLLKLIHTSISLMTPFLQLKSRNNATSPFFSMIVSCFCDCLISFAESLHHLAFGDRKEKRLVNDDDSSDSDDEYNPGHFNTIEIDHANGAVLSKEQQLVFVLRNLLHTKNFLIPFLVKTLFELGSDGEASLRSQMERFFSSRDYHDIENIYDGLTTLVLNGYTQKKTNHLLKFFEDISSNRAVSKPVGLRTYALEMLLELSLIHSRFENITAPSVQESNFSFNPAIFNDISTIGFASEREETLTSRIFEALYERIAELYMEIIVDENIGYLTENDALQFVVEITFIRNTLKSYENQRSKNIYNRIFELIEQLSPYDSRDFTTEKLVNDVLAIVTEQTEVQLGSLRKKRS